MAEMGKKGKMRIALFGTAIAAALFLFMSMAFAECCDCQVSDVTIQTTYEGSGQYCLQTTVPAGEGTYYSDSVAANSGHYEGYQYVYSDGASASSYDYGESSSGSFMTQQKSYYSGEGHQTITAYTTCITGDGKLGAMVYVSGNKGYGFQGASSSGFVCVDFTMLDYTDDTPNYYIDTGASALTGGEASSMTYYMPSEDVWGASALEADDGEIWMDIQTTQSLDLCTALMTEFVNEQVNLSNNGTAHYLTTARTEGNATFTYVSGLNTRATTTSTTTTSTTSETTTTETTTSTSTTMEEE